MLSSSIHDISASIIYTFPMYCIGAGYNSVCCSCFGTKYIKFLIAQINQIFLNFMIESIYTWLHIISKEIGYIIYSYALLAAMASSFKILVKYEKKLHNHNTLICITDLESLLLRRKNIMKVTLKSSTANDVTNKI